MTPEEWKELIEQNIMPIWSQGNTGPVVCQLVRPQKVIDAINAAICDAYEDSARSVENCEITLTEIDPYGKAAIAAAIRERGKG